MLSGNTFSINQQTLNINKLIVSVLSSCLFVAECLCYNVGKNIKNDDKKINKAIFNCLCRIITKAIPIQKINENLVKGVNMINSNKK